MNAIYWLWLQNCFGYGKKISDLIYYYGSAKQLYESGESSWRESGFFSMDLFKTSSKILERMKKIPLSRGEKIIKQCDELGVKILTPDDEEYPKNLKRTQDYPAVLFVKGDTGCLNEALTIAVIGTRKPSVYGISAAQKIAGGLAKSGAVIVSGGALGIDSIAHQSAIAESSKTILVMGCGFGAKYLAENAPLRKSVCQNGAVITEYPPFTSASLYSFPQRNRIISGISKGIVIVEAGEKSGTLNTAGHAKRQGRDIFAVPGDIASTAYCGSNKLIAQGARAVFSAGDIVSFYSASIEALEEIRQNEPSVPFESVDKYLYGEEPKQRKKSRGSAKGTDKNRAEISEKEEISEKSVKLSNFNPETVSDNAKLVYNHMSGEELSLDEITRNCAIEVRKVLAALTELELAGAVKSCGAGRYSRL